jgi:hypothetical protein
MFYKSRTLVESYNLYYITVIFPFFTYILSEKYKCEKFGDFYSEENSAVFIEFCTEFNNNPHPCFFIL